MCSIDATVWQVGETILEGVQMLTTLVSMSGNHFGYIQLPVLHPQTGHSANIKHKRKVEDMLLKTEADFSQSLTLVFQRESVRAGSDKRPTSQPSSSHMFCF